MEASLDVARSPFAVLDNRPTDDDAQVTRVSLGYSPVKPVREVTSRPSLPSGAAADASSPRMGLFAVPPQPDHDHVIICPRSAALLLGRARVAEGGEEDEAALSTTAQDAVGGVPAYRFSLPNTARHVSRDHCVVYHTPFGASWAVKILGQNGLIVDGKRHRPGSILRLSIGETVLDFFGVRCLFVGAGAQPRSSTRRPSPVLARSVEEQDGRSPDKSSARVSINSALTGRAPVEETPVPTRRIGNVHKRPIGAPLSPPTSSPAGLFDNSSPGYRATSQRLPALLATSSPSHVEASEDDEEDDEDYAEYEEEEEEEEEGEEVGSLRGRTASPTLNRRHAIPTPSSHDDSGILMQGTAAASTAEPVPTKPRVVIKVKRRSAPAVKTESPTSTPRVGRDAKRVKFTPGSAAAQDSQQTGAKVAMMSGSTMLAVQTHYRALVAALAKTYDVQGLLAGAIVFHRTATISGTEAVRSVLSSNPGLMRGEVGPEKDEAATKTTTAERGQVVDGWTYDSIVQQGLVRAEEADKERVDTWQRKAWRERLEESLMEGECFGIIQRAGKDASGQPLECWYYYDKDLDTDAQRAANLGALVKPMRAALKTHKPIFWRKSAYGTSSDDVKVRIGGEGSAVGGGAPSAAYTESQWGSSGSTLKAALLSSADAHAAPLTSESHAPTMTKRTSTTWEETQLEETEQTWDKEGDMEFEAAGRRTKRGKK